MHKPSETGAPEPTLRAGIYRHYKGQSYEVYGVASHSETQELLVVYRPLYGEGALWVRPLAMFTEMVSIDERTLPRFEFVSAESRAGL